MSNLNFDLAEDHYLYGGGIQMEVDDEYGEDFIDEARSYFENQIQNLIDGLTDKEFEAVRSVADMVSDWMYEVFEEGR